MACTTEEANPVDGPNAVPDFYALEIPSWLVGTWGYESGGYNRLKPHIRFTETTICQFDHDGTPTCLDELLAATYREDVYMPRGQSYDGFHYYLFYGVKGDFMYNDWNFYMINENTMEWVQTNGDILRLTKME